MHTEMIRAVDLTAAHIGATIDADPVDADHVYGMIEQFTITEEFVIVRVVTDLQEQGTVADDIEFGHEHWIHVTSASKPSLRSTGERGGVHISASGGSVAAHTIGGKLVVGDGQITIG